MNRLKLITNGIFLLTLCIFFSQCAMMKKDNRRLTNYLDENLSPESDTGKLFLVPLAIPMGTISLLSDAFIVQPIVAIPKALGGTIEYIWQNPSGGVLFQSFLFVPKLIMTPITLGVLWIRHTLFY